MTVPPLTLAEIAELRAILDRNDDQYHCVVENGILESLIYRAEDHARLRLLELREVNLADITIAYNGACYERDAIRQQLEHRQTALDSVVVGYQKCIDELDALRAEVATLKAENTQYAENLGDIVTYGTTADRLDQQLQVIVAERDTLKARIALLEAVRETASRYVITHAGQVVRFQDASLAQQYEDAGNLLDAALAALEEK